MMFAMTHTHTHTHLAWAASLSTTVNIGRFGLARLYNLRVPSDESRQMAAGRVGCHAACNNFKECLWIQNKSVAMETTLWKR